MTNKITLAKTLFLLGLVFPVMVQAARWQTIDTIKIDGVANCLSSSGAPGGNGNIIAKSYDAGTYQFSLLSGTGISYNSWLSMKPSNGASVTVFENAVASGRIHAFGLSQADGNFSQIIVSNFPLGAFFFVGDGWCSDNSGSVSIAVKQWK